MGTAVIDLPDRNHGDATASEVNRRRMWGRPTRQRESNPLAFSRNDPETESTTVWLIQAELTGATGSASANQKGRLLRDALAKPVAPKPSMQE